MKLGGVALLALVAGCYIGKDAPCDPGPFFSGPNIGSPLAASAGDRVLVHWTVTDETNISSPHGAMLGSDGAVIPDTRFDFDPDQKVLDLISGPDRVLVKSGLADQDAPFMEIRLPTGERQGARLAGVSGRAAFDGDAFLVGRGDGTALRIGLDGTVSPTFPIPQGLSDLAPLTSVTWAVLNNQDVLTASRITRGGAVLDVAPRPVTVIEKYSTFRVASRPTEAAIVTQGRVTDPDTRTWITLSENGTISAPVPLVLDLPYYEPRFFIGERDGYLLVLYNSTDYKLVGVHISPTGAPGERFELLFNPGATVAARSADRTMMVYRSPYEPAEAPRIDVMPIDSGVLPGDPLLVDTVEGETYTVDCLCNAAGGSAGPLVVLALGLSLMRRRRSRG